MRLTVISVPDLEDHEFLSEVKAGDVFEVNFDRTGPFEMAFVTFKPGCDCSPDDLMLAGIEFSVKHVTH